MRKEPPASGASGARLVFTAKKCPRFKNGTGGNPRQRLATGGKLPCHGASTSCYSLTVITIGSIMPGMSKTISTNRETRTIAIKDEDHRRLRVLSAKFTKGGTLQEGMSLLLDFFEEEQKKDAAEEHESFSPH